MTGSYGERVTPDLFTNSGKIDGWNPFSEVQMVAYYLAPATGGGRGQNLVRVVTRNLLPVQESEPEEHVLMGGVESATLLFYDGYAWVDTWDSTTTLTLPTALKLSLVMAPRGTTQTGSAQFELVVPVLVTTTTSQTLAEEEAVL
jgi:hypothetical protein